ncbi:MAG TPA: chemotaxis protein CheW, partial [Dissulfurispiraceae bacterium]|nr:chemotaxis protein CheW [Dissulfurispiraceae bacterium]
SVSEVLRIPSSTVEPTPPMASNISAEFIKGIAKVDERLIILLDMDRLLGKTEGVEMMGVTTKAIENRK